MLVVILAGGEGRRIGGNKPARVLGDRSLLDHAIDYVRRLGHEPLVSVGSDRVDVPSGIEIVHDAPQFAGPVAGLAAGLEVANERGADALAIIPVDMPFLPDELIERLGQDLMCHREAGCAMAQCGAQDFPVCSIWRVDRLREAVGAGEPGDGRSLKSFFRSVGGIWVHWPEVDGKDPFLNVNDPSDLRRAGELREQG